MQVKILILLVILTFPYQIDAQEKQWIPGNYKGMSFREFVSVAEEQLEIKIFYKEEWVTGLKLGDYSGSKSISDVFDNLLRGTSLYYCFDKSGNVVITKTYAVKTSYRIVDKEAIFLPPSDYSDGVDNKEIQGNITVEIGNPADRNKPGTAVVSGYITDRDTKENVAGVTVFNQKLSLGAISNEHGFYSLTLPRGSHTLQFSFIGKKEKSVNLNLNGSGQLNVEMNSVLIPLGETVVSAQKNMTIQRFEVGAEKINITSFKLSPTSLGEADIIKSILLIPGVQSVGEGSTGFNVRGGSSDQNLILLYGAPLYNSSHFFGFFSAVNADIIKDVTLYKGGIPSRYGGRISSVLDIASREGNRKEFAGTAGISPITTQLMVEGPLIKDTLTYLFTARTTYSDYILRLIDNPSLQNSSASFYDFNGKLTYDLNKNNKIDLSSYFSYDSFRFNSDTVYTYKNNIFVLSWRHFFSSRFFSSVSVNNSFYKYDISSNSVSREAFVLSHKTNSTGLKADFNWFLGRNEINFGLELNRYAILPGSYVPSGDSSLINPEYIDTENALEGALYIDDKIILTNYLSVDAGIRLSSFYFLGPGNVMVYDPGYSKSPSTITDTLSFKAGEVSGRYAGPELRLSFNFRLSNNSSLKINYNRTRQYIHLLSNSTSISPTDTWKLSDYNIKPQIGDQIALGFYKMLFNNGIESSAEIYYKKIKNMVDFKGGTNLIMDETIAENIVNVDGKAYGLELMLKKTEGKLRFSLGYTYARTFVKSMSSFSEEIINGGNWFPANFDKPNDLVVTLNYILSRRFSFSTNYTWSTGRPITYPVASYPMYRNILVHYSDRNKYRVPDYSRLDVSCQVRGNLRKNRIIHPYMTFSVYNLLGRQNVYSIYFQRESDMITGYKLSVFGQAIPTVTFNFDF